MARALTTLLGAGLVALGMAWGWVLWGQDERYLPPAPVTVHCPAEDSCQVDYRDGGWWARTYDDHSDTLAGPWVKVTQ